MTIWFANGTKGTVEDISNEGLEEPVTVYNFEVADFHTYFIGERGVLVHNNCTVRDNYEKGHQYQESVTEAVRNDVGTENVATEITFKRYDPDTDTFIDGSKHTIRIDVIDTTGTADNYKIYEVKSSSTAGYTKGQEKAGVDVGVLNGYYKAVGARAEEAGLGELVLSPGTKVTRIDPTKPYVPVSGQGGK